MKWKFDAFALLRAVERRRAREGLSKRALARQLGLRPSVLVELGTRQRTPSLDVLLALLEWLGDDINDIWDFAERQ